MSTETIKNSEYPEELSDILLVLDKEKMKIEAVKSIDEKGKMETVEPTKENKDQFMRVDRHGDFFSNFFSNFLSQLKNPTKFSFFNIPAPIAVEKAMEMQNHINSPTKEGENLMDKYKVKETDEHQQKKENTMETSEVTPQNNAAKTENTPKAEPRFKEDQVDWQTLAKFGISKEVLKEKNLLDPLLKGYKSNEMLKYNINFGSLILRGDAKISLTNNNEGKVVAVLHGIHKNPAMNFPFFGHTFTDEDKENLRNSGNMGHIVDLTQPHTGKIIPSVVSRDKDTNELIAYPAAWIKIPNEIRGVILTENEKKTLQLGKPLFLEGMISKNGDKFNATLQYSAYKHYVELVTNSNNYKQLNQPGEAPKIFRGRELSDEEHNDFKNGQTIYIDRLIDKKGQPYQGYITFNKETGKTNFEFPNQYKERIQPTETHRTQIAVNSQGKTNEATKNITEPLKSGQQRPENKQQQDKQDKPTPPKKVQRCKKIIQYGNSYRRKTKRST